MRKYTLVAFFTAILFSSCFITKPPAIYGFNMYEVSNVGQNAQEPDGNYYEDDIIGIGFGLNMSDIALQIENKTKLPIKIVWDEAMYVDTQNESLKIMHKGIKFIKAEEMQIPTVVVPKSIYKDVIVPTSKIDYSSATTGWAKQPLLEPGENDKTIRIYLPIVHNGVVYDYIFSFNLKEKIMKGRPAKRSKYDDSVYR